MITAIATIEAILEDGFILDKVLLTANPDFVPSGQGPAEKPAIVVVEGSGPALGAIDVLSGALSLTGDTLSFRSSSIALGIPVGASTVGRPCAAAWRFQASTLCIRWIAEARVFCACMGSKLLKSAYGP